MKIVELTNPEKTSLELMPWYVEVDQTSLQIGWELYQRMQHLPEDTLVLAVLDEMEQITGITIAYARYSDVFIWQARSGKLTRSDVDKVLARICEWAKSKGFKRIAAVPNRNPRVYSKRWGFIKSTNNEVVKEI